MTRYKGDNSGGYGNPPIRSQFKKGGSGGPGRPKGGQSMETVLRQMLCSKIPMKIDGVITKVEMPRALAERLRKEALTGSSRMLLHTIDLAAKYGPQEAMSPLSPEQLHQLTTEFLVTLPDEDFEAYGRMCKQFEIFISEGPE